jgi:hypothetical protein
MSKNITERYDAKPYGFYFTTRERGENDFDSKQTERSCMYFLDGKILSLAEVESRKNPDDRILISNMRGNGYNRVIENTNSWKAVLPFTDKDTLLNM